MPNDGSINFINIKIRFGRFYIGYRNNKKHCDGEVTYSEDKIIYTEGTEDTHNYRGHLDNNYFIGSD